MFENKRVFMFLEKKNDQIQIDHPIATVRQLIDNPLLATEVMKEMLIYQDMGFKCRIYVEGTQYE